LKKREDNPTKLLETMADELGDCVWPDPSPVTDAGGSGCLVDDMSRFEQASVDRIFFPRSEADVERVLAEALRLGRHVCVRGTKHSMGGHSIARAGFLLDMQCLNAMRYDQAAQTVSCGPGCLWADLIMFLNKRSKSPRTMQSYCTFSVGGTLSVNAHGITTDFCMAESVESFRLMRVVPRASEGGGGYEVATVVCRPGDELFRLALGGYGLFGIITKVTLHVVDNMQLELDTLNVRVSGGEFCRFYESVRNCSEPEQQSAKTRPGDGGADADAEEGAQRSSYVAVKIARINILDLDGVQLFVYRRAFACSTITGDLGLHAHEMPMKTRILYKWLMPAMKEVRFAIEDATGQALDMADETGLSRNELLFESAIPLAKLCDPLFVSDDTFVLQEFFVPAARFGEWIDRARPVYQELADADSACGRQHLMLLNTTIRFVEHDTYTFLSYASVRGGSYAFVLYYRIPRTEEAERELGNIHNKLAEITVEFGGSFYLPYRRCYSAQLLERAYPQIREFAAHKQKHDPLGIFSNTWFDHYLRPMCDAEYGRGVGEVEWGCNAGAGGQPECSLETPTFATHHDLPRAETPALVARTGSYRALLHKQRLREEFKEQFLVTVFNLADNKVVMDAMTKAAWDPRNKDDLAIFRALRARFHGTEREDGDDSTDGAAAAAAASEGSADPEASEESKGSGPGAVAKLKQAISSIKQLHRQKRELTRECAAIVGRLGKARGDVRGYASFGDNGKLVLKLRAALGVRGRTFVCHDRECTEDDIPAILERGSLDPVGEFVAFDYMAGLMDAGDAAGGAGGLTAEQVCTAAAAEKDPSAWLADVRARIPDGAVDLVSINQGLHHIPPARLLPFLREVSRILRPGGLFIFREHDLNLDCSRDQRDGCPVEMLDLAHSVFNAVTGVVAADELAEVRAFRPLDEWRAIVGGVGLVDMMMRGLEEGDPTLDEMLCFAKPPLYASSSDDEFVECISDEKAAAAVQEEPAPSDPEAAAALGTEVIEPPIVSLIKALVAQVPAAVHQSAEQAARSLAAALKRAVPALKELLLRKLPLMTGQPTVANLEPAVSKALGVVVEAVEILGNLMDAVKVRDHVAIDWLHGEFFLILPAIERKVRLRPDEASSFEKTLVSVVREYAPALLLTARSERDTAAASAAPPAPAAAPVPTLEDIRLRMYSGVNLHFICDGDVLTDVAQAEHTERVRRAAQPHVHENTGMVLRINENEGRLGPFSSWCVARTRNNLTHGDGSGPKGGYPRLAETGAPDIEPPRGWAWSDTWHRRISDNSDSKGWEYAVIWGLNFSSSPSVASLVRRRHWTRHMYLEQDAALAVAAAEAPRSGGAAAGADEPGGRAAAAGGAFTAPPAAPPAVAAAGGDDSNSLSDEDEDERKQDPPNPTGAVTGPEILTTLCRLEHALPGLLSANTVSHSGFSLRQQSALVAKFGGTDLESTAAKLATFLNRASWQGLQREMEAAAQTGDLPTRARMLCPAPEHAWRRCLKAFLRSPLVRLEAKGKFGLRLLGLQALSTLHDEVKASVNAERHAARAAAITVSQAPPLALAGEDLASVHTGMQVLADWCPVRSRTLRFDQGVKVHTLPDVAEIVHATFGYTSLTSSPTDITDQLAALHASQQTSTPGVFVVSAAQCQKSRNSGSSALHGLDATRKAAVQLATLGRAGTNRLDITYRCLSREDRDQSAAESDAAHLASVAESVRGVLRRSGGTSNLHSDDGEYTWFKLSEWMQVEIMEVMAQSLNHTPWYRFPFFEALRTYFDVLRTECDVVARKHGSVKAYASMAFVTDLVPGVVMTAIFAQMHLLAAPLRATFGDADESYASSAKQGRFMEEVVLFANIEGRGGSAEMAGYLTDVVDERISDVRVLQRTDAGQVVTMRIPPFKQLGEVLLNIARHVPTARVLEISGQAEVQVRVSHDAESAAATAAAEAWLARLGAGVEVVARYAMPINGESATQAARKQIALGVGVTHLMQLLRGCSGAAESSRRADEPSPPPVGRWRFATEAVRLEQVYDFYV
jgi:FAD/FMN-containing dehydrogenase/SAM-dependent methyltransferase